jgi:hypothetical protein
VQREGHALLTKELAPAMEREKKFDAREESKNAFLLR